MANRRYKLINAGGSGGSGFDPATDYTITGQWQFSTKPTACAEGAPGQDFTVDPAKSASSMQLTSAVDGTFTTTTNSNNQVIRAVKAYDAVVDTDKVYFEVEVVGTPVTSGVIGFGFYNEFESSTGDITSDSGVYFQAVGGIVRLYHETRSSANTSLAGFMSFPADGDILGIAYDMDAKKVFFHLNGTWFNGDEPGGGGGITVTTSVADANNKLRPMVSLGRTNNSLNMNGSDAVYAPSDYTVIGQTTGVGGLVCSPVVTEDDLDSYVTSDALDTALEAYLPLEAGSGNPLSSELYFTRNGSLDDVIVVTDTGTTKWKIRKNTAPDRLSFTDGVNSEYIQLSQTGPLITMQQETLHNDVLRTGTGTWIEQNRTVTSAVDARGLVQRWQANDSGPNYDLELWNVGGGSTEIGLAITDRLGNDQVQINRANINDFSTSMKLRRADGGIHQVRTDRRIVTNTSVTLSYTTANTEFFASSNQTITVPNGGTFPIGAEFWIYVISTATVTVAQGTGATLQWGNGTTTSTGSRTITNGGWAKIIKRASGTYQIIGQGIA